MSSRRQERRLAIEILFQADVTGTDGRTALEGRVGSGSSVPEFTRGLVEGVSDHLEEIDRTIASHSEGWTVDRMASVDRTVLRVAAYELAFGGQVPGVAIDEAVRAAKDLSTEDSGRFVNGILGKIARELDPDQT
ncbi:MAG TPA: transcription antitermination factor NusB [Actinomycetota bacterium]|nr:transcription antitermination factor NusB [Actinomycetota bacterium]